MKPPCLSASQYFSSLDALLEYTSCRDNNLHPPELGCTLSASRAGMHSPEVAPIYDIVIGGVVGGSHWHSAGELGKQRSPQR